MPLGFPWHGFIGGEKEATSKKFTKVLYQYDTVLDG